MNERLTAESITQAQLTALYESLETAVGELEKLRRVYEWSVERWGVERRRMAADLDWMRTSVEPTELVSQLREATGRMAEAEEGSSDMDDWERRWADHFTALGLRLQKAESALGVVNVDKQLD